jgi:hypothetical protein
VEPYFGQVPHEKRSSSGETGETGETAAQPLAQ